MRQNTKADNEADPGFGTHTRHNIYGTGALV